MDELKLISDYFNAISSQTDLITQISTAGLGAIIFTWLPVTRKMTLNEEKKNSGLAIVLIVSMIFFTIAVVIGYLTRGQITGFYHELIGNVEIKGCGSSIKERVNCDYRTMLKYFQICQLTTSVLGIAFLVGWYICSYISFDRGLKK